MNTFLWILQALLALHTGAGATWKFSHSEQTIPSLKLIPHAVWMGMSGLELVCVAALILPAFSRSIAILAPLAATCILVEMLAFTGLHLLSGETNHGEIFYWLVVAAVCGFIAYGRFVVAPFER